MSSATDHMDTTTTQAQGPHQLGPLPRYIRPRRSRRGHWADLVAIQAARRWRRRHPIRAALAWHRARAARKAVERGEVTPQGPHPWELIWLPGDRQAERESLRLAMERLARFGLDQFDRWGGIERLIEEIDEEWDPPPRPPLPWPWEGWWR